MHEARSTHFTSNQQILLRILLDILRKMPALHSFTLERCGLCLGLGWRRPSTRRSNSDAESHVFEGRRRHRITRHLRSAPPTARTTEWRYEKAALS
jgi:hypothetical protein